MVKILKFMYFCDISYKGLTAKFNSKVFNDIQFCILKHFCVLFLSIYINIYDIFNNHIKIKTSDEMG